MTNIEAQRIIADYIMAHKMTYPELEALVMAGEALDDWISVEDRLPEKDERVFILQKFNPGYFADIGRWRGNEWAVIDYGDPLCSDFVVDNVTHWMPIPEPPEGE